MEASEGLLGAQPRTQRRSHGANAQIRAIAESLGARDEGAGPVVAPSADLVSPLPELPWA